MPEIKIDIPDLYGELSKDLLRRITGLEESLRTRSMGDVSKYLEEIRKIISQDKKDIKEKLDALEKRLDRFSLPNINIYPNRGGNIVPSPS